MCKVSRSKKRLHFITAEYARPYLLHTDCRSVWLIGGTKDAASVSADFGDLNPQRATKKLKESVSREGNVSLTCREAKRRVRCRCEKRA